MTSDDLNWVVDIAGIVRTHISFFIVLICLLCGCAHERSSTGRGDVGKFILQRTVMFGSSPTTTTGLPAVAGRWRYSEDARGVVIHLSREQSPAVESLLRQAIGQPQFGSLDRVDGQKFAEYRLTPKGGGIQFASGDKGTQVILIRPFSRNEESDLH